MDIIFRGTIQLIDGQNIYTYQIPDRDLYYGKTGLNTKDMVRKILLIPGAPKTIDLGVADAGVFLTIISDNDITLTLSNSSFIRRLPIKAQRINSNLRNFGFFISTINVGEINMLEIESLNEEANVDIYFALFRDNEMGPEKIG